ncbi:MAG TPA: NTP transferase domain-containing protein [Gemmataceae bacterium]|nr:NTP transferase domain-containing protein [Gemmataceae bacterium]
MSTAGAIILSRMDSRRLPGKALVPVRGRPLVDYVLGRCRRLQAVGRNIILATSDRAVDDPLAAFARVNSVSVFRGSADDVAGRVLGCARHFGFDYFVRVNGDSPLIEPPLIDRAVRTAVDGRLDLVTNLLPRSFPYGVSAEVVRTAAFADAYARMERPEHREHVTKYLYEHVDRFTYVNISCPEGDLSRVRMTVDTTDDLDWFGGLVDRFGPAIDDLTYTDALPFCSHDGAV